MQINSNITAVITNNSLLRNESAFALSTGKLSSGYKINTAGDDPTGYAISGRMRQQLEALKRADINATTGRSVLDTADGALSEVTDMIQRLNEIAIKASNGTMSANDRADMQNEVEQLIAEIDRISGQIELNGKKLIDGSLENHGYCESNKNIHVEEYNDKVKAGGTELYNFSLVETVDLTGKKLNVTVTDLPESWGLDNNTIKLSLDYPGYIDYEKIEYDENGKEKDNGEAVSAGTYTDGTRGTVKICEDGSQFITLKGANGESLTLALDKEITKPQDDYISDGGAKYHTKTFDIQCVKIDDSNDNRVKLTITGEGAMDLHIGANEEEMIKCSIPKMSLKRLDLDDLDVGTMAGAQNAIDRITRALSYVSSTRSRIGAYTNRVEHSLSYLAASTENLTAAMSRIQDTDMAEEMTNYASQQILVQAATSMLAQANQAPQQALQLIQ